MNKNVKDVGYTLTANILNFIMGFVTGFLIPKFMGIDDYAYLKLFTFYTTYIGLTHFGFLDGIYIKYGAYEYEDLPKEKFRGYFKFLIFIQVIEAIILSVVLYNISDSGFKISFFVILNMVILNVTTLFTFIHQITRRFKIFSVNTILSKFIYIVGCSVLLLLNITQYMPFIILQTLVNIIILLIYVNKNKEIFYGASENIFKNLKEYWKITKIGFLVMMGNFMTILILGIDRLFVDKFWGLEEFAIYSFAYTLISLFYIFSNSIATVIYPFLARVKKRELSDSYGILRRLITLTMGVSLIGYFAIKVIVSNFLPKYTSSLGILCFLVPTVIYSAQINILISNFYKVLKHTRAYTKNNLYSICVSICLNVIAVIYIEDVVGIAIATLISFIWWVIYSDFYFKRTLNIKISKNILLDLSLVSIFLIIANIENIIIATMIYSLVLVLVIIFNKNIVYKMKELIMIKNK
ncbi:MAG: oligosaccharide flippase family protein [Sarcina sp.]